MENYPSKLAILSNKSLYFRSVIRKWWLKCLGLKIGTNSNIGKIRCEWPSKVHIGSKCSIEDGVTFWVKEPFKPENSINLGDNVFIGRNCEFNCSSKIIIRSNCLIASKTVIVDVSHEHARNELINIQPIIKQEIIIEEDVWVGTSCTILKGVVLGKGCIIGANSLVNKSVPSYEIWAGVPARKIGERK